MCAMVYQTSGTHMIHQWMEWDIQLEFESWVSINSSMEWGKLILMIWLVVSTPLKNMKVSWGDYSQ